MREKEPSAFQPTSPEHEHGDIEQEKQRVIEALKAQIESDRRARDSEVAYIAFGSNPEQAHGVTFINDTYRAIPDFNYVKKLRREHNGEKFWSAHNHTYRQEHIDDGMGSIPTASDFAVLLTDKDTKGEIVFQLDPADGRSVGHYIIRKTERTPDTGFSYSNRLAGSFSVDELNQKEMEISDEFKETELYEWLMSYRVKAFGRISGFKPPVERQKALDELAGKAALEMEYVPEEGYRYVEGYGFFAEGKNPPDRPKDYFDEENWNNFWK